MASTSQLAGSVSVEVVADLSRLDAGLRDATTRSKAAGTQIAGDLSRVESAAKGAGAATDRLAGSQARAGASTARAATASERWAAQIARATAVALGQQRAIDAASAANDNLAGSLGRAGGAAGGSLAIMLRFGALAAIFAAAAIGAAALTAVVAALAALVPSIIQVGTEFKTLERGFAAAAGSAKQGEREFNFISQRADQMGLKVGDAAQQFVGFLAASRGTALQGRETREIFIGITDAMTALGKDSETTGRALVAVQQMMSKGKVGAEEMTGQLGEALPGALNLSAKAMGVTEQALLKLMGDGKLLASDLLPKLAKELQATYGDAAAKAAGSFTGSMNRLSNAWKLTQNEIYKSGFGDAFDRLVAGFSGTIIDFLRENQSLATGLGQVLASVTDGLRSFGGSAVDAFYGLLDGGRAALTIFRELDAAAGAALPSIRGMLGGVGDAILGAFSGLPSAMSGILSSVLEADKAILNGVIGAFVAAYEMSVAAWGNLPAALAELAVRAGNALIKGIEGAANFVLRGVDQVIGAINSLSGVIPGVSFEPLKKAGTVAFGEITAASTGAATKIKSDIGDIAKSAMSRDYLGSAGGAISKRYNDLTESYRKARDEARKLAQQHGDTENAAAGAGAGLNKAGDGAKKAADAAKEAKAEFEKLKSAAEDAFKKLFPEETLRKQGAELQGLLDKYRDQLAKVDPRYPSVIDKKIKLNLDGKDIEGIKDKSEDLAGEMSHAFRGVFDEMFSAGNKGFDGLLASFTKSLSRIGSRLLEQNILGPLFSGKEGGAGGGFSFGSFDFGKIEKAVSSGSFDGIMESFGDLLKPGAAGGGKAGGFMSSKLGGGLMSAGVGGAIGYQSQNPLIGALGGAASGYAMGGPVGGVIGGVAGLLGGLFGQSEAKKAAKKRIEEQLKAYREAYEEAKPEIEKLQAMLRGDSLGAVGGQIDEAFVQAKAANKTASQGGDQARADQIMRDFEAYALRMRETFMLAFEGTLSEVAAGFGTSGPFAQANAAVAALGETLKAFVKDSESLPDAESNSARARAAAIQGALNAIEPPRALSDTQQELARIQGTAAGLERVLRDLGMSAEEAGAAIRERTDAALRALRDRFEGDLGAKINEATGKGYLNEVADLVRERDALMADARAIGSGTDQVSAYFRSAAQKIVDGSELTGAAFDALVRQFPDLEGAVVEFGQAIDTAAAKAEAAARRLTYRDRTFAAGIDTGTEAGALAAFDRRAAQERAAETKAGGQAMADLEKALAAERTGIIRDFAARAAEAEKTAAEATARRVRSAEDRLFAARNDASTLTGRLAEIDRQHAQERLEEVAAGGEALAKLEAAQAAERLKIVREAGEAEAAARKQALAEAQSFLDGAAKSIKTYLDGLKAGPETSLAPGARLGEAQKQFDAQLALARSGDRDAMGSITTYADRLLEAGKGQFASGAGYQDILAGVTEQLGSLPSQVSAEQFIVDAIKDQTTGLKAALALGSAEAIATALKDSFDSIDLDTNGLLSQAEFLKAIGPKATEAEQKLAKEIFNRIDLDGDGQISRLEALRTALGSNLTGINDVADAVNDNFDRLDQNGSGGLSLSEFKAAFGPLATQADQEIAEAYFREIDADGNNIVTQLELTTKDLLDGLKANSPEDFAAALRDNFPTIDVNADGGISYNEMVKALGPKATKAEQETARLIFRRIDVNGNGIITKAEAVRYDLLTQLKLNDPAKMAYAISKSFETIDLNADAKIDWSEFNKAVAPATKAEQDAAKAIFESIDTNGDGFITAIESANKSITDAVKANDASALAGALDANFKALDTSVNGVLDKNELAAAIKGLATVSEQKSATALIKEIDKNGDGQLSKAEIIAARMLDVKTTGSKTATNTDKIITGTDKTVTNTDKTVIKINTGNDLVRASKTLLTTIRSLSSDQKSLLGAIRGFSNDQKGLLEIMKDSAGTQAAQLALLYNQYDLPEPVNYYGFSLENNMIEALNKIVYNTARAIEAIRGIEGNKFQGFGVFSEGGYTGSGGRFEPAGIVHKGEIVWSQIDIARAGGVAAVEAMRLGANDNWAHLMPAVSMPMPMLAGRNESYAALIAEVRALRAELSALRGEVRESTDVAEQGHLGTIGAVKRTTVAVQEGNAAASRQSLARKPKAA